MAISINEQLNLQKKQPLDIRQTTLANVSGLSTFEYFTYSYDGMEVTVLNDGHPLKFSIDSNGASRVGKNHWTIASTIVTDTYQELVDFSNDIVGLLTRGANISKAFKVGQKAIVLSDETRDGKWAEYIASEIVNGVPTWEYNHADPQKFAVVANSADTSIELYYDNVKIGESAGLEDILSQWQYDQFITSGTVVTEGNETFIEFYYNDDSLSPIRVDITSIAGQGAIPVPGAQGPVGETGAQGPQGLEGAQGLTGEKGEDGADGAQGPQGEAGINGEDGAQGPQGDKGEDGVQGPKGEDGAAGADGAQGPAGENGQNGEDGAQGPQGAEGAQGAAGENGINGEDGAQGPQGVEGAQGAAGENGTNGEQGPQGDKGEDGWVGKSAYDLYLDSVAEKGDFLIVDHRNFAEARYNELNDYYTLNPVEAEQDGDTWPPFDPTQFPWLVVNHNFDGATYIRVLYKNGERFVWKPSAKIWGTDVDRTYGIISVPAEGDLNLPEYTETIDGTDVLTKSTDFEVQLISEADYMTKDEWLESLKGTDGTDGAQGVEGAQGAVGEQGPQGEAGVDGAQGPQGTEGAQGSVGETGEQGPQGEAGIDGSQGPQGEKGEAGAQGPQGDKGTDGDQGPQGEAGTNGEDGAQGPQGEAGTDGEQGPQGEAGAQGDVGDQGPQGEKGEDGTQGPQGEAGINGEDGAQGPQGLEGAQGGTGEQGPQGEKGEDGTQGPQGEAGTNGEDGAQGPQGVEGSQGAVGDQGPQGETGAQGPQGDEGVQGPQGDEGTQGPQGEQGNEGSQGPQGVEGAQGIDGSQGPQGLAGTYTQGEGIIIENDEISLDEEKVKSITLSALTESLIPEDAQEALDTLEEIAAWIQEHPEDAAAMNRDIAAVSGSLETLEETVNNLNLGDENVIEDVKLNGTSLEVVEKSVNIDLSGYTTSAALETALSEYATSADTVAAINQASQSSVLGNSIIVAGGPLADDCDTWPTDAGWTDESGNKVIPAGTSIEEVLVKLFSKVTWPTPTATYAWNVSSKNPTLNLSQTAGGSNISSNQTVEAGTIYYFNGATANTSNYNYNVSTTGYSNGYKKGSDGAYTSGTYSKSYIAEKSGDYTLAVPTVTGFKSDTAGTTNVSITGTSVNENFPANADAMYANDGSNSIVVRQTGMTYTPAENFEECTIYAASNVKTFSEDCKVEITDSFYDGKSTTATGSTTSRTVTGYRKYFYGLLDTAVATGSIDATLIRSLTGSTAAATGTQWDFPITAGKAQCVIAVPSTAFTNIEIFQVSVNANIEDVFDTTTVMVPGANGYKPIEYKVWTFTPASPYPSSDTYKIKFKN